MSINIRPKNDYSALFSSFGNNNYSVNNTFSLADYASIKNGSYGKLMKAYYAKKDSNTDVNHALNKLNDKNASIDSAATLSSLQSSSASLVKSADELTKTGSSSVFNKKDITTKDENGVETTEQGYDKDAIYKAVSSFVDSYNSVLGSAAKSNNKSVINTAADMATQTVANQKLLNKVGITIGADNKLTIDEKSFKAADMSTAKTLFSGNGSYAYGVEAKASFIQMYAKNDASKASGIYSPNATFNSSLISGGYNYNSFI